MKVLIIGGGLSGMLAAISSSYNKNNEVTIFEKMNMLGKKLLITGKGRCNITSSIDIHEFIQNITGNGKFMYSAFENFSNEDIIELLNKNGVKTKVERGNRVFPASDKSIDVRDALERELKNRKVKVRLNSKVKQIIVDDNNIAIGIMLESGEKIYGDKVILCTGGKSYPLTGSTGDGYIMAKELGHTITSLKGSLIPLTSKDTFVKELQGLSLRNVKIVLKDIEKNKNIYEDFGEMLFTHFGVSGPTILSSSAHLLRYKNSEELLKNNKIKLIIDLKPALSNEQLDIRIRRDFEENKNKQFKNSLDKLLPKKMIDVIIKRSMIDENKKVNEITKEERRNLVELLKNFDVIINGFRPIEEAIITAGGINVKEINPKTMESKLIKNLYFAGEIIDVDAYTGGFNLQIAYSTGYVAGKNNE